MATPIVRTDLGAGTAKCLKGEDLSSCLLTDVMGREIKYEDCNFSAAILERGYFFHAQFVNCNFTGARFVNCNFRQATFLGCKFDYADFYRCHLPVPQILANLPSYANVRWELLHNLRANSRSTGDTRHDSEIVRKEIDAEIEHWRAVRRRPSGYYQKYNNTTDQTRAWLNNFRLFIERYVWGHGESLARLFIATITGLLVLAIVHWAVEVAGNETPSWSTFTSQAWASLGFVFQLFIDLPSVSGTDVAAHKVISAIAVLLRYVAIGLAIPVLYKHISKR